MTFTLYLQTRGVCKEKPVTGQNNAEKWLIQNFCNVLGTLLLIRQWDCSHLSTAYCTEMKQQQPLIKKALNKQKSTRKQKSHSQLKLSSKAQCVAGWADDLDLGKELKEKEQKDLTITPYMLFQFDRHLSCSLSESHEEWTWLCHQGCDKSP